MLTTLLLSFYLLAQDPNGLGFKAYQAGDYPRALKLFEEATRKEPKNAYAWLNHARTLVALEGGRDPDDYCEFATNWIYRALASLSRAVALDREKVLAKLDSSPEPKFAKFRTRPEFRNWQAAVSPPPAARIPIFLGLNPEWHTRRGDGLTQTLTFEKSKVALGPPDSKKMDWRLEDGRVAIGSRKFEMRAIDSYFDEGKRSYRQLVLKEMGGAAEVWELGPILADCP